VILEVITVVLLKIKIIWDVMPCHLVNSHKCYERM